MPAWAMRHASAPPRANAYVSKPISVMRVHFMGVVTVDLLTVA